MAPEAIFRVSAAALSLFALFGFNPQTLAATDTWTGASGTSTDWATANNWVYSTGSGPVASGDALIFTSTNGVGTTTLTDTLTSAAFSIAGITFTSSAPAYTMTGNAFAITAGILDSSTNTETINNAITIAATHSITAGATGSYLVLGGVLSGAGGITVNGPGGVELDAANTYTGVTTVASGSLTENFAATGAPANNIIASTTTLTLGGGTLKVVGASGVANTQTFASTTVTAGRSTISAAPSSGSSNPTITLGALNVQAVAGAGIKFVGPATIGAGNVAVPATATITTTTAGLGLFGSFYNPANTSSSVEEDSSTVGLYDWATTDTTAGVAGTSPYTIIGGSQVTGFYQSVGITTAGAYDYNPSGTNTATGGSDGLIRFNYAGAGTITSNGGYGMVGFLVTPNVGANNDTIAGTSLQFTRQTSAVQGFGTFVQNNTLGYLNVSAPIVGGRETAQNNGLVQSGGGTVVYTGANSYEGSTYLNGGYSVVIADNGFGLPADAGTTPSHAPGVTTLYLNGGTVVGNATFTMDNSGANKRPVTLLGNGGGLAATAGTTMTIDGLVESTVANNGPLVIGIPASNANGNVEGLLPGSGAGTANTTAVMATGTVVLNAANGYFGGTVLDSGVLNINGINALGGANYGGVTLNGGTLQYATGATGNGSLDLTSVGTAGVSVGSIGGTIDLNGNVVTYAGSIGNGGSGTLTVMTSAAGGSLTLSGANTFTGGLTLTSGTLTLGGANVNTGLTSVNGGTLTLASGGSLGNTAITVAAGAKLQTNTGNNGIGTGTGASVTLAGATGTAGGTLSLADGAIGTLAINGNLTVGSSAGSSALDFDLNSTGADSITVSGGVLGGTGAGAGAGKIFITTLGTTAPANGQQYTLITAASGLGTSLFALGTTSFNFGTQAYTLSLSASTGTAEILTANFAALNYYWTGNSNTSWGTLANFATDHTGATAQTTALGTTSNVFETADTATGLTQSLNGSFTINSLNFTGAGTTAGTTGITLNNGTGTNILTISAANSYSDVNGNSYGPGVGLVVQAGSAAHTINTSIDLGGNQTWQINNSSSNPLTVNGVIADGTALDALTVGGTGKVIFQNAETYDGGTTVTGGTLELGIGGSLLATSTLTVSGSGTFDVGGNNQTLSNLSDGGVATGTLTNSGTTSNTITLNNTASNTFRGTITDNGATVATSALGLNLNGTGTVTLSGSNSYNGLTSVNGGGILVVSSNYALGNSASANGGLVLTSGTVEFTSASPNVAGLDSTGATGAGTSIILGNATAGTATTLTVGAGGALISGGLDMPYSGTISDLKGSNPAAIGNLTVTGGSYLVLGGANTFTGTTTVVGANTELQLINSLALQDSTFNNSGGGLLNFASLTSATIAGLNGTGNLVLTNNSSGGVILTIGTNNVSSSFTGNLSGLGGVSKIGTGTLTLSNATYTGNTVVYGGTLNFGSGTNLTTHLDISADYNVAAVTITGGTLVSNSGLYITSPTGGTGTIYGNSATLAITGGAQVTVNADGAGRGISYGDGNGRPGGNGSLTIGTVGDTTTLVTVNGALDMYYTSGGSTVGNFALNLNGGTLATQTFQQTTYGGNQTGTLNLNGGTLESLLSSTSFIPALTGFTVESGSNGAIINTNGYNDTIAAAIIHGSGTPDGGLVKNGAGALTLSGVNTYTGPTIVNTGSLVVSGAITGTSAVTVNNGGTLALQAPDGLSNTAPLTLATGVLQLTYADSEALSTLTLGTGASSIAFGTLASNPVNTLVSFADSSAIAWNGTLSITNWVGNGQDLNGGGYDQLFIGSTADLTAAQLADITFVNPTIDGVSYSINASAVQLADGEIVAAVPEPGTWAMLLAGVAMLGVWQQRNRRLARRS